MAVEREKEQGSFQLPEQFLKRMQKMLGEEYPDFLQSYKEMPFSSLRLNPQKTDPALFSGQVPFHLSQVPWEPNGFYYDTDDRPGRHPYHDAGVYYIQEASAMAPVHYLDPKPGERVLDLCAAPGGKTTQIAAAMDGRGILVSNEPHPQRAKILSENVERMGIRNDIVTNEMPDRLAEVFPDYFDRILVDAPCSGEGMFRKNEEARTQWSPEAVTLCAGRQDEILAEAAKMLAPGGRLVYSTCTFAPDEDEGTILRFLEHHPDFSLVPAEPICGMSPAGGPVYEKTCSTSTETPSGCAETPSGDTYSGMIRLWPHRLKGEGHFLAVLEKEKADEDREQLRRQKTEKGLPERACAEYQSFCRETLQTTRSGVYLMFGEQLYLAPPETPRLAGLRVLRPGLHLGTVRKGHFTPSHALALTLRPGEVKRTADWHADAPEIAAYLQGQTIASAGEKGWCLVTVDGYSLGWGKRSGDQLKNHYPKGLRKP